MQLAPYPVFSRVAESTGGEVEWKDEWVRLGGVQGSHQKEYRTPCLTVAVCISRKKEPSPKDKVVGTATMTLDMDNQQPEVRRLECDSSLVLSLEIFPWRK